MRRPSWYGRRARVFTWAAAPSSCRRHQAPSFQQRCYADGWARRRANSTGKRTALAGPGCRAAHLGYCNGVLGVHERGPQHQLMVSECCGLRSNSECSRCCLTGITLLYRHFLSMHAVWCYFAKLPARSCRSGWQNSTSSTVAAGGPACRDWRSWRRLSTCTT